MHTISIHFGPLKELLGQTAEQFRESNSFLFWLVLCVNSITYTACFPRDCPPINPLYHVNSAFPPTSFTNQSAIGEHCPIEVRYCRQSRGYFLDLYVEVPNLGVLLLIAQSFI